MQRVRRGAKKKRKEKKRKEKEEKRKKEKRGKSGRGGKGRNTRCVPRAPEASTTTLRFRGGKILFRFVTACTKLSVIYEPVQLPGTGPSTLKIHGNAKIDGRAVAVIIIINHRGHRTRILRAPVNLYCLLGRDVL